jgi:hypothetical protein
VTQVNRLRLAPGFSVIGIGYEDATRSPTPHSPTLIPVVVVVGVEEQAVGRGDKMGISIVLEKIQPPALAPGVAVLRSRDDDVTGA